MELSFSKHFYTDSLAFYKRLTVLVFIILFTVNWFYSQSHKSVDIQLVLETKASEFTLGVADTLHQSVEDLQAVSSVITLFEETNYEQFVSSSKPYLEDKSGLLILEWQPVVLAKDRHQFIQNARQSGQVNFDLWEPDVNGTPVVAGVRTQHVPVLYMVSSHQGADTTGLDLAWSEQRMLSKLKARDTARPQSSDFFKVVTGKKTEDYPVGIAITYPIYLEGSVPGSLEKRKEHLLGYMAGVYSLETLLAPHIEKINGAGINIRIKDGTDSGLVIDSLSGEETSYSRTVPMHLFNKAWSIELIANEQLLSDSFNIDWYMNTGLFIVFGIIILLFVRQLERTKQTLIISQNKLSSALRQVQASENYLLKLSRQDPLTGLFNRRAFEEFLALEIERYNRLKSSPAALVIIDIDFFKKINDQWGHPVGDVVLKRFAEVLKKISRDIDMAARIGGEEFAMILINTDEKQAFDIAERLRQKIESLIIRVDSMPRDIGITVSMGVSVMTDTISDADMIQKADEALFIAKEKGRNKVEIYCRDV